MSAPGRYGSDLIVDLLAEAGIEHVAFNPGATFRGIHDSLVARGDEPGVPQIALCLHESISVSAAQAYAKAAGRPMAALVHNVVGLQNASMSIYNAWCDRTPLLVIGGTGPLSKARRRPWIDWIHTASVQAQVVRDFVKWDDEPRDVESVTESFSRALQTTVSAPGGPVYLCYDVDLQEQSLPGDFEREALDSYARPAPPSPPLADAARVADLLATAQRPGIVLGYAGEDPDAFAALVALAERVGARVVDTGVRLAFPSAHPLNVTSMPDALDGCDVVLVLDVDDPRGVLQASPGGPGATIVNVTLGHLRLRGWAHDYQPLAPSSMHLTAQADAAVDALLACLPPEPSDAAQRRAREIGEQTGAARAAALAAARGATADGAVALERLLAEVGAALAGERFVLANATKQRTEHALWSLDRPRQYLGWEAGGGLGYGLGALIGSALASPDAISVGIQPDGDLMYAPGALWTMARLRLPALVVMNNNRQYGNTVEHAAKIATSRGRGAHRRYAGAGLADPPIDFAGLAAAQGVWARGPITDPAALGEALEAALAVVRSGRPALLDVVTAGF